MLNVERWTLNTGAGGILGMPVSLISQSNISKLSESHSEERPMNTYYFQLSIHTLILRSSHSRMN